MSKEVLQILIETQGIAKTKAQLKQLEKSTGNTSKSFGLMAAGIAGATASMVALGKSIQVGARFEKSMAKVAAVSNASTKELEKLTKTATGLGKTTAFTASEVADLQTEFAKLGFTASEIDKVTKGTLDLAGATGTELATAASVAGATLRGFGYDVDQTNRVTNLMAASFSQSALDMTKFQDSMKYVAPVAKIAGFELEGTTAMLGQLANAGIDGSMAGTALRKIFLELSNGSSKLAQKLGGPISSVEELAPAFKRLKEEGLSTADMKDLVGQRAVSAFSILLDGAGTLEEVTSKMTDTNEATRQYDAMMNTFQGSTDKFNSAMEGLGITIFGMVQGPLRGLIDGSAEFISNLDEKTLKSYVAGLGAVGVAYGSYQVAANRAAFATKNFSKSLVKSGLGALVVIAGLATGKILDMIGVFDDAVEPTDNLNDSLDDTAEKINNISEKIGQAGWSEMYEDWLPPDEDIGESMDQIWESLAGPEDLDGGDGKFKKFYEKQLADAEQLFLDYRINQQQAGMDARQLERDQEQAEFEEALEVLVQNEKLKEDQKLSILTEYNAKRKKEDEKYRKDKAKADKIQDAAELAAKLNHVAGLAGALGGLVGTNKANAVQAARLAQAQAAVDMWAGANKALAQGGLYGFIGMATVVATGLTNIANIEKSLGNMKKAQYGMSETVDQPTLIMAGEAGAENVNITPLEGPNVEGPQGGGAVNISISGNVMSQDYVETELREQIANAVRRGTDFGMG